MQAPTAVRPPGYVATAHSGSPNAAAPGHSVRDARPPAAESLRPAMSAHSAGARQRPRPDSVPGGGPAAPPLSVSGARSGQRALLAGVGGPFDSFDLLQDLHRESPGIARHQRSRRVPSPQTQLDTGGVIGEVWPAQRRQDVTEAGAYPDVVVGARDVHQCGGRRRWCAVVKSGPGEVVRKVPTIHTPRRARGHRGLDYLRIVIAVSVTHPRLRSDPCPLTAQSATAARGPSDWPYVTAPAPQL